jgi:hypothetical protein
VAETALESFDEGVFHRRKGKESDVAMRERIKAMESLQLFLLTDGALREAGVILRDLPKSEVDAFRAAKGVHEKARGALVELSRFVGSDAVRFANLVADIPEVVSEFAPLLSQLPSGDQRLVFSSLMEAAQARRDAIEVLEERVLNKSMSESDARLARHAFNEQLLVVLALPAARQKTREAMASGDILQMLQKRSDASRMSARLFHDAFKGSGDKIELNDVVGVEFRRTDPGELTEKERQAMQTIHWENWKSQPETAAILQKKFERTLQGGLRTFYLLKKDGAVAGFARFDFEDADGRPLPRGETYFGSFNVTPAMRGSAMGEAMLRNMFDAQSDMTIHFESDTRHAISMKYVEDGKAVIEKVERYVDDTPDDIFHLRTSPAIRKGYKGKEMQKDVMVRGKVSAPLKVESFSRRDEAVDAIERELKSGRVVSRFFEDRGTFFILSEPKLSEEAP